MRQFGVLIILALIIFSPGGKVYGGDLTGDSTHGESLFDQHCGACHSLTANRVGPSLSGIYGRKAGSVDGFNYSKAVQSASITWGNDTLDQWLTNPQKLIPGQRMNFNISDPQKRADIIAYLKSAAGPGNGN
jgi:cytochrome c